MMRFHYLVWADVISHIVDMLVAYALALPIAWDREAATNGGAGLRTFPIVAMASCGFVLIGIGIFGEKSPQLASILYGLIVGIGFIGSGTILKNVASREVTSQPRVSGLPAQLVPPRALLYMMLRSF